MVVLWALAIFFGEWMVLSYLHYRTISQFTALASTCQAFLQGDKKRRVIVQGSKEVKALAREINLLMDLQQNAVSPQKNVTAEQTIDMDITRVQRLLRQLVNELYPALEGDLRVKATLSEGLVGDVADFCNALIEKMVQFTHWTLYASEQTLTNSRLLLERSVTLAKATEAEMITLSQVTRSTEQIVSSIQRMGSTLQLGLDAIRETTNCLKYVTVSQTGQVLQPVSLERDSRSQIPDQVRQEPGGVEYPVRLLEDVVRLIPDTVHVAETMMNDLYTLVRQMHQSGTTVLQTTEQIDFIINLAEEWQNLVREVQLPKEKAAGAESS
jgi:methyl-accepting chemotaxis protein